MAQHWTWSDAAASIEQGGSCRNKRGPTGRGYVAVAIVALLIGRCTATESGAVQPVAAVARVPPPVIATSVADDIGAGEEPLQREIQPGEMSETETDADEGAEDDEPSDVYYRNCSAARAAGAAPIHVGEPGYASHLDRDDDGVACE
jgi:hypothetical protein